MRRSGGGGGADRSRERKRERSGMKRRRLVEEMKDELHQNEKEEQERGDRR